MAQIDIPLINDGRMLPDDKEIDDAIRFTRDQLGKQGVPLNELRLSTILNVVRWLRYHGCALIIGKNIVENRYDRMFFTKKNDIGQEMDPLMNLLTTLDDYLKARQELNAQRMRTGTASDELADKVDQLFDHLHRMRKIPTERDKQKGGCW